MKPILTGAAITLVTLAAVIATTIPAGSSDPFRVRIVTMNGVRGPAYYSNIARSYRFVAASPADGIVAALDEPAN